MCLLCLAFVCVPGCPSSPSGPSTSPTPRLEHFIAHALHRTRLNISVTFAALYLLQRLKARFPTAKGSSGHRLFISAFMIAFKIICDDTYSNKSWCIVGQGMFDPSILLLSFFNLFRSCVLNDCSGSADHTYSNKSWYIVGQGTFALREISQMELEVAAKRRPLLIARL